MLEIDAYGCTMLRNKNRLVQAAGQGAADSISVAGVPRLAGHGFRGTVPEMRPKNRLLAVDRHSEPKPMQDQRAEACEQQCRQPMDVQTRKPARGGHVAPSSSILHVGRAAPRLSILLLLRGRDRPTSKDVCNSDRAIQRPDRISAHGRLSGFTLRKNLEDGELSPETRRPLHCRLPSRQAPKSGRASTAADSEAARVLHSRDSASPPSPAFPARPAEPKKDQNNPADR